MNFMIRKKAMHTFLSFLFFLYHGHKTFTQNTRVHFYLSSFFLAASRVFQMASLFIPIKLLILLSKHSVPAYMQTILKYFSTSTTIWLLALSVPLFFLGYIICGIFFRKFVDIDAKKLTDNQFSLRGTLLTQKQVIELHQYTARAQSECIVISIGTLAVLWIAWTYGLCLFATLLFLGLLTEQVIFHHPERRRVTPFNLTPRQFIEYTSSMGYIVLTLFLCLHLILFKNSLNLSILCLLTSRMIIQSIKRFFLQQLGKPRGGRLRFLS
jgi:hypothetical protein